MADDIEPVAADVGQQVASVVFSVGNGNAAAVTAVANLRFYAVDPTTGLPSTYLLGLTSAPLVLAGDGAQLVTTAVPPTTVFPLPAEFYAGIAFSDGTGTAVTPAQLDNLGQLTFDPPTVGISDDVFFQTDAGGSFAASNPAGQAANFGWQFTTVAVPEPAAAAGLAVAAALVGRRRATGTR